MYRHNYFPQSKLMKLTKDELSQLIIEFVISERFSESVVDEILPYRPDLKYADPRTGFDVFHASAAMGDRKLFDYFRSLASFDPDRKDHFGRTASDVAAVTARDFELCSYISGLRTPIPR